MLICDNAELGTCLCCVSSGMPLVQQVRQEQIQAADCTTGFALSALRRTVFFAVQVAVLAPLPSIWQVENSHLLPCLAASLAYRCSSTTAAATAEGNHSSLSSKLSGAPALSFFGAADP